MAGFRKAKGEQSALKIGMYGPPGSGKTFTALLIAEGLANVSKKRIAVVDTERGTDFYCQDIKSRKIHPKAFEFDALYTKSVTEASDAIKALKDTDYGVIVIDSISHIWEATIAAYAGKRTKIDTIPIQAWGRIKKPYKDLINYLLSSSMHVILCGRQRTVFATDEETEEMRAIGVTMKAESETPYEPHITIRMQSLPPRKTNEIGSVFAYIEKDRTGVLAGHSYENPTFDTIGKPILSLLGKTQAQIPTEDETAAQDAEKLTEQQSLREQESVKLLENFTARITLCGDLKALKEIGKEITPKIKSKMGPDEVANLREKYLEREAELRNQPPANQDGGEMQSTNDDNSISEKAQALLQELDAITTSAELKEFRKVKRLDQEGLEVKEQLLIARHWQSRKEVLEDKDKSDKSQGKLQV